MIRIQGLVKEYGVKRALHGLDLEVPKGEFFCFLGPNGAGKTTTIKVLCGLLLPTAGKAFVGGHDIVQEPVLAKRKMAYIPDHPFLYGKLTAMELMEFVGGLYGMHHKTIHDKSLDLLDFFGLSQKRDTLIENFSHGMRQKLVFASAFLHDPEVLIVDEPWIGLDPLSIRKIKIFLKEQTQKGLTIFMSTHTLSLVEETADRIGILSQGRLVAVGDVEMVRQLKGSKDLEEAFLEMTIADGA